jgi:hypothetical protein
VESNWVHSARRPPIGLLYPPRVIMNMENLVEWWLAGDTEVLGENLPQCHFVHHKSYMTWPGAKPGRRGGKPGTNRLSYGTANIKRANHILTDSQFPLQAPGAAVDGGLAATWMLV